MKGQILLVDDEPNILKSLERLLRRKGYSVVCAANAMEALWNMQQCPCPVVLTDFRMPQMDGGQLLQQIKTLFPACVCMVLSGYADFSAVMSLLNSGTAYRFLQKPWDDETLLKEIDGALQHYEQQKNELIRNRLLISSHQALLEVNHGGTLMRCNLRAQELLGKQTQELFGCPLSRVLPEVSDSWLVQAFASDEPVLSLKSVMGRPLELHVHSRDQAFLLLRLQFGDYLPQAAEDSDPLSPLLNQGSLLEEIQLRLQTPQQQFAVVICQIRNFSLMTHILGFYEAEHKCHEVAMMLQETFSSFGKVGYLDCERLIILLDNIVSDSELHQLLQSQLHPAHGLALLRNQLSPVEFDIAYCLAPEDGGTARTLLSNCLLTVELSREANNRFIMRYNSQLAEDKSYRFKLSEALYHAVDREELSLKFQPKVNSRDGTVTECEVLLRWHHPFYGDISPAVFIPIAEQEGQILELGEWVLRQTCMVLQQWLAEGIEVSRVSVNLSGVQILQPDFIERMSDILRISRVAPQLFEFEVTESWLMSDTESCGRKLQALKAAGVSVSIDDFGTGHSSLAYLTRLPVDTIKIDRSLVLDLEGNLATQSMVRNITRMAHELGLRVVVEGVESTGQQQLLAQMDCDLLQGFLFAAPLAEPEYRQWLASRKQEEPCP